MLQVNTFSHVLPSSGPVVSGASPCGSAGPFRPRAPVSRTGASRRPEPSSSWRLTGLVRDAGPRSHARFGSLCPLGRTRSNVLTCDTPDDTLQTPLGGWHGLPKWNRIACDARPGPAKGEGPVACGSRQCQTSLRGPGGPFRNENGLAVLLGPVPSQVRRRFTGPGDSDAGEFAGFRRPCAPGRGSRAFAVKHPESGVVGEHTRKVEHGRANA